MNRSKLPQANKTLGQHFLNNQKIIETICHWPTEWEKERVNLMVEVGPGPAILTQKLREYPWPFYVIEKDRRFIPRLQELLGVDHVFNEDALEFDWSKLVQTENAVWLISNLPYNVSVPLLIQFLKIPQIQWMTLMFQKEVAAKILFEKNHKGLIKGGSLGHLTQTFFQVEKVCHVLPGHFTPPPKVDSTVLKLSRYQLPELPLTDFLKWEKFLRLLFQFPRKVLTKSLATCYEKEEIQKAMAKVNLSLLMRAEDLERAQILGLYRELA